MGEEGEQSEPTFSVDAVVLMGCTVFNIRQKMQQLAKQKHKGEGPVSSTSARRAIVELGLDGFMDDE